MKQGRKILCLLLAVILLIGCMPMGIGTISAFAEGETSGTCGEKAFWNFNETTGELIISGTGAMNNYLVFDRYYNRYTDTPWKEYEKSIKSVTVQDGITSIGNSAFACCNLKSVILPNSVTALGKDAFLYCSWLTSIKIPDSVTSIGDYAFLGCSGLTAVNIPNGVTKIGNYVFQYCSRLPSITIPDTVTSIGKNAFLGCDGLTSITIPDSVTAIGDAAFYDCLNLVSVTLSNNLTFLDEDAFRDCKKITSIKIPGTLREIPTSAFSGCKALASVTFSSGNTRIGPCAFSGCYALTSIVLPEGMKEICYSAFAGCLRLTSITLPRSADSIAFDAFDSDNENLTLYGAKGSYAEEYAAKWGFRFVPTSFPDPGPDLIDPSPDPIDPDPDPVDPDPVGTRFQDVDGKAYYAEAVKWAVEKGITSGTDKTHFSPNASCTRAQAVTFLWRAAGEPEPRGTAAGFTDVKAGAYYEKAVQWAVEQGITAGTGVGKFSPEVPCTRGQIVAFLWRKEGSPEAAGAAFGDVQPGAYYETAVKWAVEQGITAGTSSTTFSPESRCVRAQIVSFLYRYQAEKP